uniref:Uncharacterized protein n=1 Tax=Physcomitrium patens TaxID=3218 RepID=A0A2K1J2B0_PHYPA|nr:hypothetical protein PHYPA_021507 [Physcomitrium patens]
MQASKQANNAICRAPTLLTYLRKPCQDPDHTQRFPHWKLLGVASKWGETKNKSKNTNKICELYESRNIICYHSSLDAPIQPSRRETVSPQAP